MLKLTLVKRLFVGNIPFRLTEDELRAWFQEAGVAAESVTIARERDSGRSRGFAFVDISDTDFDTAIRSCHGKEINGRALVVTEAKPSPSRQQRS